MAGLVPAIHVLATSEEKDVDARHKAGHDENSRHRVRGTMRWSSHSHALTPRHIGLH
jgi:hypothetical protein